MDCSLDATKAVAGGRCAFDAAKHGHKPERSGPARVAESPSGGREPRLVLAQHVEGPAVLTQHQCQAAAEANCAYVDVYSTWEMVLQRKDQTSLLGNNINHPNDFGHWLYAQAFAALRF